MYDLNRSCEEAERIMTMLDSYVDRRLLMLNRITGSHISRTAIPAAPDSKLCERGQSSVVTKFSQILPVSENVFLELPFRGG